MFLRWKETKYSQISIYQFFGVKRENLQAIPLSKIQGILADFCKSYKNKIIRLFLHAEFISALKTEQKSMVFEKYAKNRKKKYLSWLLFNFL